MWLGMPLEFWQKFILWTMWIGFAMTALGAAVAVMSSFVAYQVSDITQVDADKRIASAGTTAALANVEAAKANEAAAKAHERAAGLEKQAAELQAANIELGSKVAPRRLTGEQQSRMATILGTIALPVAIVSRLMDAEGSDFADDIVQAFTKAKWSTDRVRNWTLPAKGVTIAVAAGTPLSADLENLLKAGLAEANVVATTSVIPAEHFANMSPHVQPNVLYILVGAKP